MATIFYSMAGEGRGHATRVRSLVESLRQDHRLVLFAPAAAYDFLEPLYRNSDVEVRPITGLLFHYKNRHLHIPQTVRAGLDYLWQMPELIRSLEQELREGGADLVLTDFEPALPRAAERAGIPVMSINHQHFLMVNELRGVPLHLRLRATATTPLIKWYCPRPQAMVVSSFYFPPLRRSYEEHVTQVGVLMRPDVLRAVPEHGGHLLLYLRRFSHDHILETLRHCGREVRVYGLGEKEPEGNLRFRPISESGFLEDLVTCQALVSNAGNQLVGEALYLGKPVFAMPEPGNFEQFINAHYLRDCGGGDWVRVKHFNGESLGKFLDNVETFRSQIHDRERLCGNPATVDAVQRMLDNCETRSLPNNQLPIPVAG
ncbi:glycosyltransferase family protein [Calycomorphotria hydatis]|uniref:Teichoic acid biosynthesis protein n=1 Tax=Calycomorphotria hydatis TaxID=2528027 RepID=A0A517TBV2_9PLAN|nr:glycosyltransferase family protein [Calycomorphotria hydatis]QDT65844.1 hypothetical protein V22_31060 [Calycomorphotria hydatis]